jgi:hypothetical protein
LLAAPATALSLSLSLFLSVSLSLCLCLCLSLSLSLSLRTDGRTEQGAIIVVSHDEAFVNQLLTGSISGLGGRDGDRGAGELWILEDRQFQRFEGSFREYKKKVLRAVKRDPVKY